jgi:hypothetical protein
VVASLDLDKCSFSAKDNKILSRDVLSNRKSRWSLDKDLCKDAGSRQRHLCQIRNLGDQ